MTTKEKFLKLAEQLEALANLSLKLDSHLAKKMEKRASEKTVELDPAHVTNFVKFYLGNR